MTQGIGALGVAVTSAAGIYVGALSLAGLFRRDIHRRAVFVEALCGRCRLERPARLDDNQRAFCVRGVSSGVAKGGDGKQSVLGVFYACSRCSPAAMPDRRVSACSDGLPGSA